MEICQFVQIFATKETLVELWDNGGGGSKYAFYCEIH